MDDGRRGWRARGRSGEDLGRIREVMGEQEADIFKGLVAESGLLKGSEYVLQQAARLLSRTVRGCGTPRGMGREGLYRTPHDGPVGLPGPLRPRRWSEPD